MSLRVEIEDSKFGTRSSAGVSKRGQLIVGPLECNLPYFNSMTVINQGYTFVEPKAGKQFIIDGIIVSSDKNVSSTNGAVVQIYESAAAGSATVQASLLQLDIGRLDREALTQLNLCTSPGVWINGKTDDNNVNVTIIGYYVETV